MGDSLHSCTFDQTGTSRHPDDRYFDCYVRSVDLIDHTFNAGAMESSVDLVGVQFAAIEKSGTGELRYPVCGDHVVVRTSQSGQSYLDSYQSIPSGKNEFGTSKYDFDKQPYYHQYLRNEKFLTGDRHWFGMMGSFLQFLRGGITRIGASPLCQTIFIKFENTWRTVCQNFQFWSCGFNMVSNNNNGEVETRMDFFSKDIFGLTHDQSWSDKSDVDIHIDKNGLTVLFGPVTQKGNDWSRENRGMIRLYTNADMGEEAGSVAIKLGQIDDSKYRQTLMLSPNGNFVHKQFDPGNTKATYVKQISQNGDTSDVDERIEGSYRLSAKSISIAAEDRITLDGKRIDNTATIAITENGLLHAIQTTSRK